MPGADLQGPLVRRRRTRPRRGGKGTLLLWPSPAPFTSPATGLLHFVKGTVAPFKLLLGHGGLDTHTDGLHEPEHSSYPII